LLHRERLGTEIVVVRPMRELDIAGVCAILRSAAAAADWGEESLRDCLSWDDAISLVSEGEGKTSGFLIARRVLDEAEILNIAVLPENRRHGEGSMLFAAALEEFRKREVRRVFLEVRESNVAAIAFYEKQGFVRIGKRSDYYREPREAAVVMEKKYAETA
jgi:ribosomal-protein-alanine acetyltransferase